MDPLLLLGRAPLAALLLALTPLAVAQDDEHYFEVRPLSFMPDPYVSGTTALDLGADGDLDLVYPDRGDLFVFENNGAGVFERRDDLRTLDPDLPIDWPRDLAVADFNGDGLDDLFIADHGDEPPDIPFENWPGGQSHLFLQTEDGRLVDVTAERLPMETSFTHATAVGDVTGNGAPDIYLASYVDIGTHPEARFYINDGTGHFTSEPERIPASVQQDRPSSELADIDLDGDLDLILGGSPVSARDALLLNDGTGVFTLAPETALPLRFADSQIPPDDWRQSEWATWNVEAADFDADGYPDLVMGTLFDFTSTSYPNSHPGLHTRVQLLLNNQDGTFRDATDRFEQNVLGDHEDWVQFSYPTELNGDGFPDLVVAVWGGQSHVFYNDGGERFVDRTHFVPPMTDSWSSVLPGDFTGDGAVDIVVPADGNDGAYLAVNVASFSPTSTGPAVSERAPHPSLTAYPNPARSSATVRYVVPLGGDAVVDVFDLLGRKVATLAEGRHAAGEHAVGLEATQLPAGLYFVRLTTDAGAVSAGVTLVR